MLRILLVLFLPCTAFAADGAKLYADHCARCHGSNGEGTKKHPTPLAGDQSVAQLADLVQKTMPENDPGSLSIETAKTIAEHIHPKFYSELARARSKPARVELARLTVKQYRHAVADVIAAFRPSVDLGTREGLNGDYFNKTFQMDFRGTGIAQRIDGDVNFDYGEASPWPGKLEPQAFSVNWQGSLIAPESGEYEFIVQTPHAGRLYLNDAKKPLIDAWVKSGKDTEFRGRIYLVGGRAYPLRLDYSKGKQGKPDPNAKQKEEKDQNAKSFMKLLWVRPHGAAEIIAARHFVPVKAAEQYVCATRFPPDDRSLGWERGTAVSVEWDAATTEAALDVASYVGVKLNDLAGGNSPEKLKAFAVKFAEAAFRRPLSKEQIAILDQQFTASTDSAAAVKRCVLLVLKSPFFLYREVHGGDAFDVASRLSFGLLDSIPDAPLLKAARDGKLKTREEVGLQAERLLKDPRAAAKMRDFLFTWLRADSALDLAKDAKKFPDFDAVTIADLRTSLEYMLLDALKSRDSDWRTLVTTENVFLNDRLAAFYGLSRSGPGFRSHAVPHRRGVLTHPYLMASFAGQEESSPIHRGVFLARGILGVSLKPPPEAVAPLPANLHPNLSTRERVVMQTKAAACMTCHGVINPLGFTLENFDAVGRYREMERGKKVDPAGGYRTEEGQAMTLRGAEELAKFIASSPEAHEAFAEQMFHHLVQQPVRAYGANANIELRDAFAKGNFNMRSLAVECMVKSVGHVSNVPKPPR